MAPTPPFSRVHSPAVSFLYLHFLPAPPSRQNRPASADSASPVVNLLPSTAANSVAESFSTAQSSPASDSTALTATASSPTQAAPKAGPAAQPSSLAAVDTQPDVGPLVDLSDTPKVAPSATLTPSDSAERPQNQGGPVGDTSQSADSQVEGPAEDAPKAPPTAPAQTEYEHFPTSPSIKGPGCNICRDLLAQTHTHVFSYVKSFLCAFYI